MSLSHRFEPTGSGGNRDGRVHHGVGTDEVGTAHGLAPLPRKASDVMSYYDGNTVAGLWNYASQFATSDGASGAAFGPSSPSAVASAAGTTGGVDKMISGADTDGDSVPDGSGGHDDRRRPALLRRLLYPGRGLPIRSGTSATTSTPPA